MARSSCCLRRVAPTTLSLTSFFSLLRSVASSRVSSLQKEEGVSAPLTTNDHAQHTPWPLRGYVPCLCLYVLVGLLQLLHVLIEYCNCSLSLVYLLLHVHTFDGDHLHAALCLLAVLDGARLHLSLGLLLLGILLQDLGAERRRGMR